LLGAPRELVRIAYRDPEHVPERLTVMASRRLGEPSLAWARAMLANGPGGNPAAIAKELHRPSAAMAWIDRAVAGTPFFVALVPG
jgi:hypothetical protein